MNQKVILILCQLIMATWFLLPHKLLSQEDICVCCDINALRYKTHDYEDLFPPGKIRKNGIREVVVSVIGMPLVDTNGTNMIKVIKPLTREYRKMKFLFDQNGYIDSIVEYYEGRPSTGRQFERNSSNRVIKDNFYYVDAQEKPAYDYMDRVTLLRYEDQNLLVMEKELDMIEDKELPDERSNYTKYEYDDSGRVTVETRHFYMENVLYGPDDTIPGSVSEYNVLVSSYSNGSLISEDTIFYDGKASYRSTTTYNSHWKPLEKKHYDIGTTKASRNITFQYDTEGNLLRYSTDFRGMECPESNGFTDIYILNDMGMPAAIHHNYDKRSCQMKFEYKK